MEKDQAEKVNKQFVEALEACCQGRSNYQLEKLVVGTHDTPQRQFMQCVEEMRQKKSNIKRSELQLMKLEKRLKVETDEIEKELIKCDLEDQEYSLKAQQRELGHLTAIFMAMPKFTYEQLQTEEERYWTLRINRQSAHDQIQRATGISPGNLDALHQMGKPIALLAPQNETQKQLTS